ncbi:MAG: Uma2 family endonuclease [Rhizobacter sp.]|nr:Uma2 family endonuclease [Chlorobiales bacterium]
MVTEAKKIYTREEYVTMELTAAEKHEFYHGEIFAMSGGHFNHAKISVNTLTALANKLRGKACQPMNSDMRIQTPDGLNTYPDVSLYCGKPELIDDGLTLINPAAIAEVLSPSTRNYDRSEKFRLYRVITSLQDYILIDSQRVHLEHFRREKEEWILREYDSLESHFVVSSVGVKLMFAELYDSIAF